MVSGIVFLLQLMARMTVGELPEKMTALSVIGVMNLYLWQPLTYMFLHGSPWHLFLNMLGLYFFGCEMENVLGSQRFLKLYIGCGALAGLGWLCISYFTSPYSTCVGASGAIYGIVGAFAAMFPERIITLLVFFVLPVTMTARTLAIGVVLISAVLMVRSDGNIAHSAHLAGFLAGYYYGSRISKNPGLLDSDLYRQKARRSVSNWIRHIQAGARRRSMKVIHSDGVKEIPSPEEIDRILDKINDHGLDSLTHEEHEKLRKAGRN